MRAAQKSECPAATGQCANQTTQEREFTPDSQLVGIIVRKITNAGHSVQQGQHGDFLVIRSGNCRYFADLAALQNFARLVGAK